MDNQALVALEQQPAIVTLVLDSVTSGHTRRAYGRALADFLAWYQASGQVELSKATVQRYKAELQGRGLTPSSVNQRLCAIRKLASEAADNGALSAPIATGIQAVPGVRQAGTRAGNWLDVEAAQALLLAPDIATTKGLRDRAILAVLLGCGLRRAEAARLTFEHVQQREGRWAIVDLVGKHGRIRTVPMPSWCKAAIDAWTRAAGISGGCVFRSLGRGGRLTGESMSDQAIADVVRCYAAQLGLEHLAAHDLRRTFAKLALKGKAPLDQIQLSLGHSSLQTTERYLGIQQDLTDAPCDRLGLRLYHR